VTALEFLANALRFIGFVVTVVGLWLSAGGMRVVVSGRIDERKKSAKSLKHGLPTLLLGIALLVGSIWLASWAHAS
jgi:O-antigen/teichoic acid export membrane protein